MGRERRNPSQLTPPVRPLRSLALETTLCEAGRRHHPENPAAGSTCEESTTGQTARGMCRLARSQGRTYTERQARSTRYSGSCVARREESRWHRLGRLRESLCPASSGRCPTECSRSPLSLYGGGAWWPGLEPASPRPSSAGGWMNCDEPIAPESSSRRLL